MSNNRRPARSGAQQAKLSIGRLQELSGDVSEELGKGINLFRLAGKNIRTYAWMNIKMCFTFACLAFLICLFTIYNAAVEQRKEDFTVGSASANYVVSQSADSIAAFKEQAAGVSFEDSYRIHSFSAVIYTRYGVNGQNIADSTFFVLEMDGVQYKPYQKLAFCSIAHPDNAYFTQADYTELKRTTGKTELFLAGDYPDEAGEIAIGAPMLRAYELTPEQALGKEITVYLKDPRPGYEPLFFLYTAKVSGVICDEFYDLAGHKSSSSLKPYFLFPWGDPFFDTKTLVRYRCYLNYWPDVDEVEDWKFDGSFTYAANGLVQNINTLNNIQILASTLYTIVGTALVVGLVLTVFLMIDKYLKVFARSGGILLSIGMRKHRLFSLLAIQLLILCVIAVPLSFVLTAAGYLTINYIVRWITNITLGISMRRLVAMLLIAIAVVVVIAFVFFTYAIFKIRNRTVKEYLSITVD